MHLLLLLSRLCFLTFLSWQAKINYPRRYFRIVTFIQLRRQQCIDIILLFLLFLKFLNNCFLFNPLKFQFPYHLLHIRNLFCHFFCLQKSQYICKKILAWEIHNKARHYSFNSTKFRISLSNCWPNSFFDFASTPCKSTISGFPV